MFPALIRVLINFAHSGILSDWSWDDEGRPLDFSPPAKLRSIPAGGMC
jgi:hypothetical protein